MEWKKLLLGFLLISTAFAAFTGQEQGISYSCKELTNATTECTFALPSACYTLANYTLTDEGVLEVKVLKKPGFCAQVITEKAITVAGKVGKVVIHVEETAGEGSSQEEQESPENSQEEIITGENTTEQTQGPEAGYCRIRNRLRERLRSLKEKYEEAVKQRRFGEARAIREEIEGAKKEYERYSRLCLGSKLKERGVDPREILEVLDAFREVRATVFPCVALRYMENAIKELEGKELNAVQEARLKALIATYKDLKDLCSTMPESCRKLAEASEKFISMARDIKAGRKPAISVEKLKEEIENYQEIARECRSTGFYEKMIEILKEHPCIAAEIYRIRYRNKAPEEVQEIVKELSIRCKERLGAKPAVVRPVIAFIKPRGDFKKVREEIAKRIGEIEIRKYLILSSTEMSREEKEKAIKELEKQKREMIRNLIKELLRQRARKLELPEEVEVEVTPGNVSIEGAAVNASVEVKVGDTTIKPGRIPEIIRSGRRIKIKARRAKIIAGKIAVDGKLLKSPEEALGRIFRRLPKEIELKEVNGKAVYAARARKTYRVLGIIPMEAEVSAEVDAASGRVIRQQKPWWLFLAVPAE